MCCQRPQLRSLAAVAACLLVAVTPVYGAGKTSKGTGTITLYYITEVQPEKVESGGVRLQMPDGSMTRYRLSPKEMAKANLEGTVYTRREDGGIAIASIARIGFWMSVPEGWEGKGNRMNPIVAFRTVAADQRQHEYGSRVFLPAAKGFETPDGKVHDGYFWVADVGGGIKGRFRLDVFVGLEPNFKELQKAGIGKWRGEVEVEALPSPRLGLNYRNALGRRGILTGLGYDIEGPLEQLLEALADVDDAGTTAEAALIHFQKQHPEIPKAEYGRGDSAITRWFLAQAAEAVFAKQEYPAGPPKKAGEPEERD